MPTSKETPASGTPILDRQSPLPPQSAPGSGRAVLLTIWYGAVAIVAVCLLLDRPPVLHQWILFDFHQWLVDQWTRTGIVGFVLSALCAYYAMIFIHELGHVLMGLCVGFRLRSIRIGPLLFSRPFRVSLYRGPGAVINGVAELIPVATDKLAWRGVAMVLGGPAANILSGMAVIFLPFPINAFAGSFIVFSITNGLNDLFPFESRLVVSDGRRIWMLLWNRERGERWLALLQLGRALMDGVLPEALSVDFLAKAIAVRDHSADTATTHAIAYLAAFHQHKDGEAGRLLETCLTYSGHAAPAMREALMSDASVFQARRRKRADLAEQWLAAIPARTQHPWFRSRAEAAIQEANGDADGAMNKLAEFETAILAFPKNAQQETLLQLLQRWKSELRRCRTMPRLRLHHKKRIPGVFLHSENYLNKQPVSMSLTTYGLYKIIFGNSQIASNVAHHKETGGGSSGGYGPPPPPNYAKCQSGGRAVFTLNRTLGCRQLGIIQHSA